MPFYDLHLYIEESVQKIGCIVPTVPNPPPANRLGIDWQQLHGVVDWSATENYSNAFVVIYNNLIYRANNFIAGNAANQPPPNDTANWTNVPFTLWDNRAAYSVGDTVIPSLDNPNNIYYTALINIPAASNLYPHYKLKHQRGGSQTQTTYTEIARWNCAAGSGNFQSNSADYYTQGTGNGILDGSLFANRYPVSTTIPTTSGQLNSSDLSALANDGNIYRLRLINNTGGANGLPTGKSGVATGAITIMNTSPFGSGTRIAFIVGSGALMRNGFGDPIYNLYQGGGQWVLELQSTTTVQQQRRVDAVAESTLQTGDDVIQYDTDTQRLNTRRVA